MESPLNLCQCCPWMNKDTRCPCFAPTMEFRHCKCCRFSLADDGAEYENEKDFCWTTQHHQHFLIAAPTLSKNLEASFLANSRSKVLHPFIAQDVFFLLGKNFFQKENFCSPPLWHQAVICNCPPPRQWHYDDTTSGSDTEEEVHVHKRIRLE